MAIDITADEALQRLIEGNERFLKGKAHLPSLPRKVRRVWPKDA